MSFPITKPVVPPENPGGGGQMSLEKTAGWGRNESLRMTSAGTAVRAPGVRGQGSGCGCSEYAGTHLHVPKGRLVVIREARQRTGPH